MDEEWFAKDDITSRLADKGKDFSEQDKEALKANAGGFVEPGPSDLSRGGEDAGRSKSAPLLSIIRFFRCCATPTSRASRIPELRCRAAPIASPKMRANNCAARANITSACSASPAGLWPSEGSVSDQALSIAIDEGFQWFGTDEGVLGRTLNIGFFRDTSGLPANADRLYKPWRIQIEGQGNHRAFPRSPTLRSCWLRVQPHGCRRRCCRFARTLALHRRARAERRSADRLHFSRWRKRLGIFLRATAANFCANSTNASRAIRIFAR